MRIRKQRPPHRVETLTIERMERALDLLAQLMVKAGEQGRDLLPLFVDLEGELARVRAAEDAMARVHDRAGRPRRTQSSSSS